MRELGRRRHVSPHFRSGFTVVVIIIHATDFVTKALFHTFEVRMKMFTAFVATVVVIVSAVRNGRNEIGNTGFARDDHPSRGGRVLLLLLLLLVVLEQLVVVVRGVAVVVVSRGITRFQRLERKG